MLAREGATLKGRPVMLCKHPSHDNRTRDGKENQILKKRNKSFTIEKKKKARSNINKEKLEKKI